jgi:stringent starvation protein B
VEKRMLKFFADKIHGLISGVALRIFPQQSFENVSEILDLIDGEEQPDLHKVPEDDSVMSKDKMAFFERALEFGIAALYLNPKASGVIVPERFCANDILVLNYSYKYRIPDFAFDSDFVVATLSFNGSPFRCVVPWHAVYAIESQGEQLLCSFGGVHETKLLGMMSSEKSDKIKELKSFKTKNGKTKLTLLKGGKEP